MELIDRRALPWEQQELDQDGNWTLKAEYIDSAPTISAVPVVRCRECFNNIPDGNGKPYCRWLELYIKDLNFFCRDGQRKVETVLPKSDAKDESLEADHEI